MAATTSCLIFTFLFTHISLQCSKVQIWSCHSSPKSFSAFLFPKNRVQSLPVIHKECRYWLHSPVQWLSDHSPLLSMLPQHSAFSVLWTDWALPHTQTSELVPEPETPSSVSCHCLQTSSNSLSMHTRMFVHTHSPLLPALFWILLHVLVQVALSTGSHCSPNFLGSLPTISCPRVIAFPLPNTLHLWF
jgi:hypothetical protein